MNLFEEGHVAIFLLLQLLDGSLVFVIFSLSAALRKQVWLSPSTCHKFHWGPGAPTGARARCRGWKHKNKSMTVNNHTTRRCCQIPLVEEA